MRTADEFENFFGIVYVRGITEFEFTLRTEDLKHFVRIIDVRDLYSERGDVLFGDGCFRVALGYEQTLQRTYCATDTSVEIAVIVVFDIENRRHAARHIEAKFDCLHITGIIINGVCNRKVHDGKHCHKNYEYTHYAQDVYRFLFVHRNIPPYSKT